MKSESVSVSRMVFIGMTLTILFMCTSALYAQTSKVKLLNKQAVTPVNKQLKALPDLVANTPAWSSNPKAGDTVGAASILNITVRNQGSAAAGDSVLKMTCQPLGGAGCPEVLNDTVNIQPLDPGKSMTYAWPPAEPSAKWEAGTYKITFLLDSSNQVKESSETNNTRQLVFTVPPKLKLQKSMPKTVQSQVGSVPAASVAFTIQIQSPLAGSKHETGKPLPIKWSKTLIGNYSTVNIQLLTGQDGQVLETIKTGAANSGEYNAWIVPQKYTWSGTTYMIKIFTPDNKILGQSGVFTMHNPPPKKKVPFLLNAGIINNWAYFRGGDLSPGDCQSAPNIPAGPQPGSQEVKIGHFNKEGNYGQCSYYDQYYFRSRVYFDINSLKGKEILEAALLIRRGDTIQLIPSGTAGTNAGITSQCDIYLLNGPWPASPQPLYDFYPGTFLKSFSLFSQGETAKVDLLSVVQGWAAGNTNQGLMLRDPVNRNQYVNSACVKYYFSVQLVGWVME